MVRYSCKEEGFISHNTGCVPFIPKHFAECHTFVQCNAVCEGEYNSSVKAGNYC